jgi:hypothetical protein
MPSRRTLALGILPSARSMLASLSPSWLRSASNAARLARATPHANPYDPQTSRLKDVFLL